MNAALNLDTLFPVALTKCCTKCRRSLPIDNFLLLRKNESEYREAVCRACKAAYKRERLAAIKAGTFAPSEPKRHLPPRNEHEKMLDETFREWREAGAAFQDGRILYG